MIESVKTHMSKHHNSCNHSNTLVVVVGGSLEKVEGFTCETWVIYR